MNLLAKHHSAILEMVRLRFDEQNQFRTLTQEELSVRLGIHRKTIYRWMKDNDFVQAYMDEILRWNRSINDMPLTNRRVRLKVLEGIVLGDHDASWSERRKAMGHYTEEMAGDVLERCEELTKRLEDE